MSQLGRAFNSLPLPRDCNSTVGDSAEGNAALLASVRTAPNPRTEFRATPLPELAQRIANAEVAHPEYALRRLQTYQTVKQALRVVPPVPQPVHEKQTFVGRLLSQLETIVAGNDARKSASKEQAAAEKRSLLSQLGERTGGRDLVHLPTFQVAMKIKGEDFAERLFGALDSSGAGVVTTEQLVDTLLALKNGTLEEKIAFIWSFVAERDDYITRTELQSLLKASFCEGEMRVDDIALEKLATSFFAKAGKHMYDRLSLADFTTVFQSRMEIQESLQFGNFNARAKRDDRKDVDSLSFWERVQSRFLMTVQIENVPLVLWLLLLILGQLAGFIVGFLQNDHGEPFSIFGWSYPVAKGSARSIQVIVIIFPFTVARSLLTFLRLTPFRYILPLDKHLDMHSHLGYHFLFWSLVHSIAHFINASRFAKPSRHAHSSMLAISQAKYYRREVQVTGIMMISILFVCYLFALPSIRKSWIVRKISAARILSNFEAFYITHTFMAVSLLVLLIIHPYPGPALHPKPHQSTTWAYLAGGSCVYLLERVARILRLVPALSENIVIVACMYRQVLWNTSILGVKLHKGGVTELRLQKPRLSTGGFKVFHWKAGQYCFLNIPELSRFGWHPFSLTSGPNDDYISFHIRSAGDWTKALYKRCQTTVTPDQSETAVVEIDSEGVVDLLPVLCTLSPDMRVYVDGPFGAPAQDHSLFDCLLLVGAGIGITPFASVLRQLMDDYSRSLCECCKTVNQKLFMPKKVYFYWMTREQAAPQFFKNTLEEIMRLDTGHFLEVNIYLTGAAPQNDLRVTVAKVAQVIQHEKDGFDALAGIYQPAPCFFGRPSWPAVFGKISKANPGAQVGVFVCGPPALAAQLKGVCTTFNKTPKPRVEEQLLDNPQCEFYFHKENF